MNTCLPWAWAPVFPTDVLRHFMYSLPNPSESERPFFPLEEPVSRALGRRGEGSGTEWTPMLCARDGTPLAKEVTGSKSPDIIGPGQLALEWWVQWGGRDGDWEWKGGGWRIFYLRPVLTSITLAFFKSMCSAHSPCGQDSRKILENTGSSHIGDGHLLSPERL